jgi:hypothetical protein
MSAEKIYENISQVALAFFGGLIGTLMRKEASSWQAALLGASGAGFVGLLVAKFCHATGVSDDMTFVFVGVSGWLGARQTIAMLESWIEERTGFKMHIEEPAEPHHEAPAVDASESKTPQH